MMVRSLEFCRSNNEFCASFGRVKGSDVAEKSVGVICTTIRSNQDDM